MRNLNPVSNPGDPMDEDADGWFGDDLLNERAIASWTNAVIFSKIDESI